MGSTTATRVARHRQGLRDLGLRPLQMWVPGTRRDGFAGECRRRSMVLREDAHDVETLNRLDDAADRSGWA